MSYVIIKNKNTKPCVYSFESNLEASIFANHAAGADEVTVCIYIDNKDNICSAYNNVEEEEEKK